MDVKSDGDLSLPTRNEDATITQTVNAGLNSQSLNLPSQSNVIAVAVETSLVNEEDQNNSQMNDEESSQSTVVSETENNVATAKGDTLRLVFTENSWVNIKDSNGRSLMNGIGYQGDSREFVLQGDTEIHLGNADGVDLFLNNSSYAVPSRARSGKTAHFELVPRQ